MRLCVSDNVVVVSVVPRPGGHGTLCEVAGGRLSRCAHLGHRQRLLRWSTRVGDGALAPSARAADRPEPRLVGRHERRTDVAAGCRRRHGDRAQQRHRAATSCDLAAGGRRARRCRREPGGALCRRKRPAVVRRGDRQSRAALARHLSEPGLDIQPDARFLRRHVLPHVVGPARRQDWQEAWRRALVVATALADASRNKSGEAPALLQRRAAWAAQ
jgi:hypothetical protein